VSDLVLSECSIDMSKCITYVTGFKMNFFFWVTFDFEKVFMVMCSV